MIHLYIYIIIYPYTTYYIILYIIIYIPYETHWAGEFIDVYWKFGHVWKTQVLYIHVCGLYCFEEVGLFFHKP